MFTIKSYTRKELALIYFPDGTPRSAYLNFRTWLNRQKGHDELMERIRGKRIFTTADVKDIIALLGTPY